MAVTRDEILDALKEKGPMVPNAIKKIVGGDTIILGAMLAELSSRKLVRISNVKRGGSPFYYLPGQEPQLESCMQYLPEKESRTAYFLKEQRVLADRELELHHRVAMRQLKDFAKEFKAQTNQGEVLFWRYFLVSEQEAITILNQRNRPAQPTPESQPVSNPQSTSQPEPLVSLPNTQKDSLAKPEIAADTTSTSAPSLPASEPVSKSLQKPLTDSKKLDESDTSKQSKDESQPNLKKSFKEEVPKKLSVATQLPDKKKKSSSSSQEYLTPQKTAEKSDSSQQVEDFPKDIFEDIEPADFLQQCKILFAQKNMLLESVEENKKNKEYDFVAKVPSAVGSLKMFIRAKDKKRLNEGDIAPALLRAKKHDLPCLFLTTGQFTKKSLKLIEEEYTGVIIDYFSK
ncbi:MAG: hypothetical protein ACOCQQ_00660 [Candidatus Nanoarchaeia archaeon]